MKAEYIEVEATFDASPEQIYKGWLDSEIHTLFTGGSPAIVDPVVGGSFSAWDGYISGKNLALEPNKKIVQTWRSTDFPNDCDDSKIEIILTETDEGTHLKIKHSEIPSGQGDGYRQGWIDYYFKPMKEYFEKEYIRYLS